MVIKYKAYYRNNVTISKAVYLENYLNSSSADVYSIGYLYKEACYCAADRFGNLCQYSNVIVCNITYPTPESDRAECQSRLAPYELDYVAEYDGDPPCNKITPEDVVFQKIQLNCSNQYPEIVKEGVSDIDEDDYEV